MTENIKLDCFQVAEAVDELKSHDIEIDFRSDKQASDAIVSMIMIVLRNLNRGQVDDLFDSI